MSDFGDFGEREDAAPESRYDMIQRQKQESMARQLDSTQRSMASIWDSEAVGIATAEDLIHQGEQLSNIEQKTDKINEDTKQAQLHLNGIKSIFGSLQNWWKGEGKPKPSSADSDSKTDSPLQAAISNSQERGGGGGGASGGSGLHPALRLRTDDAANFFDDDIQTFDNKSGSSGYGARSQASYGTESKTSGRGAESKTSGRGAEWDQYEAALGSNLDTMSSGLSNLKLLAKGLNTEIEAQNDQVDRIMPKVDRADTKIRDQNRQMKNILGK